MPHLDKFAASAAALALQEPAEAGILKAREDTASHESELRPITLHFSSSSVDFRTSIPTKGALGDDLTVAQLRDILLNRGLLSSAEHVALFDAAPAAARGGVVAPQPLADGHCVSSDTLWVLQEAQH